MRKRLIVAITFLAGVYFIIEFLLPEYFPSGFGPSGAYRGWKFGEYQEEIFTGLQAVSMAAIGLGLINILRVFGVNVLKRRKGWPFSLTLICSMIAMMTVMFWDWSEDLSDEHLVGPLGAQRKFQGLIQDRIAGPMAASRPAKEAALGRYIDDTRASVAPPDVSVEEAAEHLESLAQLLKGAAPGFFELTDGAPSPLLTEKTDLLAAPAADSNEPLRSDGAADRLAELAQKRDALSAELNAAGAAIKALSAASPAGEGIAKTLTAQAAACRTMVPRVRDLAAAVGALADAERNAYVKPDDLERRYKGGAEPPPPPPFGKLYIASRAMKHTAHILDRFANVLDRAAVAIPQTEQDQRALADWLQQRLKSAGVLEQRWRELTEGDLKGALPAAAKVLAKRDATADPFRARVLEDLGALPGAVSLYDQALEKARAARKALAGEGEKDARLKAAAEHIAAVAKMLETQATGLRQHQVRRAEQDLRYLDLAEEDAATILPASLAELAASSPDAARALEVFKGIADTADAEFKKMDARQKELHAVLDAEVKALRKVWKEKSSLDLYEARGAQDKQLRAIEKLKSRASFVADAQKIAQASGERLGEAGGIKALRDLSEKVLRATDVDAAQSSVEEAFRTLEDQRLALVGDAAKTLERLAYKDNLKDLVPLMSALAGAKALSAAEQSASMLRRAAWSAALATDAVKAADLPKARALMQEVRGELGLARMGAQDALAENGQRSVVKGARKVLFQGLYVALGAAMFSLLAFYIASAAYRAFRIKSTEAVLMMIAALLVMLGQIPFGAYIWGELPAVRLWVMQVFSTPAFRGIALGASVAFLAMALRMWLSLETKSFYQEEGTGEEGA